MNRYFSSSFKLGVLGGGQLGRMLLRECIKYDVQTYIMDANPDAPCKNYCDTFIQGNLMDYDAVYEFGKQVDLLTIEIEHINIDALEQLEKEGLQVFPQPHVLRTIQHKGIQKDFYEKNEIPTAPYERFENKEELRKLIKDDAYPIVWKSAQFGYDGMGVKILRGAEDVNKVDDVPGILEELIPFKNELAVIVSRSPSGEVKYYPVVEMEFHPEANQVEYVICPARISEEVSKKATEVALKVADSFGHVGLLAVEMFQTENDNILVNEVAPRTHNSGHYSIEGSYTSQFEQHLRSILDLPLGSGKSKCPAVMVNLVGAEGYQGPVVYQGMEDILKLPGVTPHIYGKKLMKPFRKMGHVTVVANEMSKARALAEQVKNQVKVISNE
ncbi:5-(carboxyamino)imidazole ribonucleotide synthase [Flavobacteriaceae bacterium]|nr:5-(carboxyamino)imidazole ribonucleotide synthase [Flavobacteriaceae bacterium]